MIACYVAPRLRAKAFGLRYFLAYSASALAMLGIAILRGLRGFPVVLGITACFRAIIFASAVGFFLTAASRVPAASADGLRRFGPPTPPWVGLRATASAGRC